MEPIFTNYTADEFVDHFDPNDLPWTEDEIKQEKKRQEKFDKQCKKAVIKAKKKRRKQELHKLTNKYGPSRVPKKFDLSTTTKQLMLFIFLSCTIVEIYSMYVMYAFQDLSALQSLITAVIGEVMAFAVYAIKSYKETKQEEINKLERYRIDNEYSESDSEEETDYEE